MALKPDAASPNPPSPDPRPDTEGSPVHDVTAPTAAWTTHNAAEVMPGVLTPLAASYRIRHGEAGLLGGMVDVGGPGSHAAIVARELGIPAVVGTEYGTASIRTGDRLRVDGLAGSVEVLARG